MEYVVHMQQQCLPLLEANLLCFAKNCVKTATQVTQQTFCTIMTKIALLVILFPIFFFSSDALTGFIGMYYRFRPRKIILSGPFPVSTVHLPPWRNYNMERPRGVN